MDKARHVRHKFGEMLNSKSLKYNWHEADETVMEGVFARGDRRLCPVILEAYRNGCMFDAWSDYFHYDKWLAALDKFGIDIDFYNSRERIYDEILPWDFLDCGVTKRFLWNEWEKAKKEEVTANCRMGCSGCGALVFGGGVCFEDKNKVR